MPRIHCPQHLSCDAELVLPPQAARHVQVLRMQPGDALTLFSGDDDAEWHATITRMGRSEVQVRIGQSIVTSREACRSIHLLTGSIANERMDWLVEKATELGAASLTPLIAERSVLKLKGERSEKKLAHWQAIAAAACEQCGRNRVPPVHAPLTLAQWLHAHGTEGQAAASTSTGHGSLRLVLSLQPDARPLWDAVPPSVGGAVWLLSGPEGGLSATEQAAAQAAGFVPVTLGPRVLRAETAPLAALAVLNALPGHQGVR